MVMFMEISRFNADQRCCTVWGAVLDLLGTGTVGLNFFRGTDVCPRLLVCVVLCRWTPSDTLTSRTRRPTECWKQGPETSHKEAAKVIPEL
jgi:hypothetical protein